jgi:large repetitive protein
MVSSLFSYLRNILRPAIGEKRLVAAVLAAAVFLVGCGGNGASTADSANIVINVSPAKADVDAGGSFVLESTVTGDTNFGGLSVSLSGAGTISTTGPSFFGEYSTVYTAPGSPVGVNPTSIAGTSASITVASKTDSSRNVVIPISLHDNIQFPAQTPAAAFAGMTYSYTLTASGGAGALTYALLPTSTPLPPGLTLSSTGVLSGTPTAVGTYNFQILVTDQATTVVGFARTITLQVS